MKSISLAMTSLKTWLIIGLLALVPALFFAPQAHAVELDRGLEDVGGSAGLQQADLPTVIGQLIGVVLSFLGIVFLLLIIYAGFLWMTAGGNTDKVGKAKKLLINGVIGLILILAAFAISSFVLNAISQTGL